MTKKQELAILDDAIHLLGPDSYLGPWLSRVRDEVAGNMRCDIFPEVLPTKDSLARYEGSSTEHRISLSKFRKKYNQLD